MSYLYSKLPETGVSPHIGTGGDRQALCGNLLEVITPFYFFVVTCGRCGA